MLNRHEYRERIMNSLYQHLLLNKDLEVCFINNISIEDEDDYYLIIKNDLLKNENIYISEISKYLNNWTFDRLDYIEQSILLLAISELKQNVNDKAIVIDEAVNLAQKYCGVDAYKYINGVLDNLC